MSALCDLCKCLDDGQIEYKVETNYDTNRIVALEKQEILLVFTDDECLINVLNVK